MNCPHCGHDWDGHGHDYDDRYRNQCVECGCRWPPPKPPAPPKPPPVGYLYEGIIDAEVLYEAFWAAAKTLFDDDSVHDMDKPYMDQEMDMIDCSGCGMPFQFWEHMARALAGSVD